MFVEDFASAGEGAEIAKVGPLLSTVASVDGPAAGAEFPARSAAVPEASDTFRVPLPVHPETEIVRVLSPVPDTAFTQPAVAVPPRVTSPVAKVMALGEAE